MLDISDIKQYIAKYEKADSKELVDEGVDAFLQNHVEWKQAIERIYGTDRGDENESGGQELLYTLLCA